MLMNYGDILCGTHDVTTPLLLPTYSTRKVHWWKLFSANVRKTSVCVSRRMCQSCVWRSAVVLVT